jgi:hypothetical protein
MVRTQIQLTEKQAKALKKPASSHQLSMAELIRQGVEALRGFQVTEQGFTCIPSG